MDHLALARRFAHAMDAQFTILGIRVGWDTLIGIVPGLGDLVSLVLSFYMIWISYKLRVSPEIRSKMITNILIDTVIGTIPLIGDLGDLFYKANLRNLKLLERAMGAGQVLTDVNETAV